MLRIDDTPRRATYGRLVELEQLMGVLKNVLLVVTSALGTGLLAAWAAIPFLTTEAGYLLFALGSAAGVLFAGTYVLRRTKTPR